MLIRHAARRQRGLSLVELMVGLTIGLLIVAAASMVMAGQMVENRRLLAGAQLQQDLRAAADIITRELRRSSRLSQKALATRPSVLDTIDSAVGSVGGLNRVAVNNLSDVVVYSSNDEVGFGYVASEDGTLDPNGTEIFQFRLNSTTGTLQSNLAALSGRGYQDLTDPNTMEVTYFRVEFANPGTPPLALPCPNRCSGGGTSCWPQYHVRSLVVTIRARSRTDSTIQREIKSRVRLRTNSIDFAVSTPAQICPP